MLATANTAVAAIERLKERGVTDLRFVCLVASPEGIERCAAGTPTCRSGRRRSTRANELDEHGYIVPGLGDAGDRLYGTR
jgi:uracil phosphoribosyltransferase